MTTPTQSLGILINYANDLKIMKSWHPQEIRDLKTELSKFCGKFSIPQTYNALSFFPNDLRNIIIDYLNEYIIVDHMKYCSDGITYFDELPTLQTMNSIPKEIIQFYFNSFPIVYLYTLDFFIDIRFHNSVSKKIYVFISSKSYDGLDIGYFFIYNENEFENDIKVLSYQLSKQ